jgi:hypothetical protein
MLADSKAIAAPEAPCKSTNAANDPATTEIQSVALPLSIERFAAAVTATAALNPSYLRPSRKSLIRGHRMKREGFSDVSARRKRIKTRGFLARVNRFVGWDAFRSELVKALPRQAHFLPGHNLRPGDHKPSQSGTQAC